VTASLVEGRPLIEAGKVRPLAHMADKRDPAFKDVPTLKELGINWTMGAWRGIAAPKGTPPEIVAILEKALDKVVRTKEYNDFMNAAPFGILWSPAAEFGKFMAEQDATMGVLMKEAGVAK
jgi:tripartite-type tricarboxylate transporter receptor subunit TctC